MKKVSEKSKRRELNVCCFKSLILSVIFQEIQITPSTHSNISKRAVRLKMLGIGDNLKSSAL